METVSFSKSASVWYKRETSLELTVRTIVMLVAQFFLVDMILGWKRQLPIVASFECQQVVTYKLKFCSTTECLDLYKEF